MKFLYPAWPAPDYIRAAVTLVPSGLDLSLCNTNHALQEQQLCQALALPTKPVWLNQVHGDQIVWADQISIPNNRAVADASIAKRGDTVCAVLTADCLPVLLCDSAGQQIAAIHAGWRGQVAGVIEATVQAMTVPANTLLAWLGPAIGPAVYEVGAGVYEQIIELQLAIPEALLLQPTGNGKWLLDLYALARFKLHQLGIPKNQIFGGECCTYSNPQLFYSYRRSKTTCRMAALIWFAARLT